MKIIWKFVAWKKFRAYVHGVDTEISGFGKVEKVGDDIVITDVAIFPQIVSGGHTVMDARPLAAFWDDLIVKGEDIGKWKLWWHSHVEMAALLSSTDFATIDEFDSEMPEENWMLSIVTNKFGKSLCRIDIFSPIRCTINDIPYDLDMTDKSDVPVDVSAEITQKVELFVSKREQKAVEEEKPNVISWYGPKVSLPPLITEDGRVLTFEERLKIFQDTGSWPRILYSLPDPGTASDGQIITDTK